MKYRSRSDIIGLILEAANGGASQNQYHVQGLFDLFTNERISWATNTKRIDRLRKRITKIQNNRKRYESLTNVQSNQ